MKRCDPHQLEQLAQQINEHPALAAVRENCLQESERMDLAEKLMKYFRFEQQALKQDLVMYEQAMLAGGKGVFDGVAFMEAFTQSLKSYDPQRGTFLACFSFYYSRQCAKMKDEQHRITGRRSLSMGEKKARQVKKLLTLLHKTGRYHADDLPRELYPRFAQMMQMNEENFRELITLIIQEQMVDNASRWEDDDSVFFDHSEQQTDFGAKAELLAPERLDELCALLEVLADIEQREYPRLFLTNLMVGLLKEETMKETDRILYARAMADRQELLWHRIFIQNYLDFVYEPTPVPDCVRNLVVGRLCRKLQNATVAEYKQVSPSAVSQSAERFWTMLRSKKAQRIQELLR